jgi:lactobin A/cerein 7B family class IIb bacteriocin
MTHGITDTASQDVRELTASEVDNVSGGLFPLIVLALAFGFDAGFIIGYGFGKTGLE